MNSNKKRILKRIAISILVFVIFVLTIVTYGLYLMDIEDRYGDLQDLYWESKDGDIILNEVNSKIGIIKFDNHRIFVKKEIRLIAIDEWLDPENKYKFKVAIYRPDDEIKNIEKLTVLDVKEKFLLVKELSVD